MKLIHWGRCYLFSHYFMWTLKDNRRRILVIRPDRVGDVILATPLIRALRQRFPESYIAAMVRPHTAAVLDHNPHLDTVILDDFEGCDKGYRGFIRKVKELRNHRFDTALMLLPTQRIAWMLFFAGILCRIGVGHKIYEMLTFMRTVSRSKYIPLRHEADYCMDLGRAMGVHNEDLNPEIFLTNEEKKRGLTILKNCGIPAGKIIIGINPGSGKSAPNWSWKMYGQLANMMVRDPDIAVVLTGSQEEKPLCDFINRELYGKGYNLAGGNLKELMTLICHFDVLVSSSTGPMHIAAALQVPTVSIFCPLPACSPQLWGPQGNRCIVLLPQNQFCLDCDEKIQCDLSGITPRQVYQAIESIVDQKSSLSN